MRRIHPDARYRHRESSPGVRNRHSTAFGRHSLGLNALARHSRRTASGPVQFTPRSSPRLPPDVTSSIPSNTSPSTSRHFDSLALVRRIAPSVSAFGYIKCARHLAMFTKFERYWIELRGRIVVMVVADENAAPAEGPSKDSIIAGVFSVDRCTIDRCSLIRSKQKSTLLRLTKPGQPHHVWLKFETERDCDGWQRALDFAASQRVVGISDFEFISPIGKGASGKVFLVTDRKTGEKLALKVVNKTKVFETRSGFRHALDERLALEMVDGHPFFTRLRYAFQTRAFFYLAIDFYDGGDLYQYLRTHNGRLSEPQVRRVASEVALALEHLHKRGFVYRDLKPENVLLDSDGHVRLADFGLCKMLPHRGLTNTICGTHTYAAPEMLSVRSYGISVDLWAFGVFVYHVLRGRTPYEARDLEQVIANMNNRRIKFSSTTSPDLILMIKRLLDWNPETRLGCGRRGMAEVRSHPFFTGVDWQRIYARNNDGEGMFDNQTPRTSDARNSNANTTPRGTPKQQVKLESTDLSMDASETRFHQRKRYGSREIAQLIEANAAPTTKHVPIEQNGSKLMVTPLKGMPCVPSAEASPATTPAASSAPNSPSAVYDAHSAVLGESSELITQKKSRRFLRTRSSRISPRTTNGDGNEEGTKIRIDQMANHGISLREKMAAAAEQDDLRNFDMAEWGKVSVDLDHDDSTYGDSGLWPLQKAKRNVMDADRLIVGYAYCSMSEPFGMPNDL